MDRRITLITLASAALPSVTTLSAQAAPGGMRFVHPPPEAANDNRHRYYWELLEAALAANRERYGDAEVSAFTGAAMNFQRAVMEVESGRGRVNIVSRATNRELESRLLAVPIPLDKGLLGARLFLVTPATQKRLAGVQTLEQLKAFSFGLASSWTDVKVLGAAGFRIVLADDYPSLFSMLSAGRFDIFSRGVVEIVAEWRNYKETLSNLQIEQRLMLQYPLPRYFFVPRTPEGERMAERIADGLQRLRANGEYERRYRSWKQLVLRELDIAGRQVLRLGNSELSDAAPLNDSFWWDDLSAELGAPRR